MGDVINQHEEKVQSNADTGALCLDLYKEGDGHSNGSGPSVEPLKE